MCFLNIYLTKLAHVALPLSVVPVAAAGALPLAGRSSSLASSLAAQRLAASLAARNGPHLASEAQVRLRETRAQ